MKIYGLFLSSMKDNILGSYTPYFKINTKLNKITQALTLSESLIAPFNKFTLMGVRKKPSPKEFECVFHFLGSYAVVMCNTFQTMQYSHQLCWVDIYFAHFPLDPN